MLSLLRGFHCNYTRMHECVFWVCGRAQWEIAGHHAYAQESPSGSQRLPALTQTRQSGCPQRWGELSWVLSWTSKLSPKFENPRSSKPCTHRQLPTYHIQRWFYTIRCKSSQNIVYHNRTYMHIPTAFVCICPKPHPFPTGDNQSIDAACHSLCSLRLIQTFLAQAVLQFNMFNWWILTNHGNHGHCVNGCEMSS